MALGDGTERMERIKQLGIRLAGLINTDRCHKGQSTAIEQGHVRCTCSHEL